jgi:hypothetical protein
MTETFQHDVFISHSAKDKPVVRELAEQLKRDGLRVWFDEVYGVIAAMVLALAVGLAFRLLLTDHRRLPSQGSPVITQSTPELALFTSSSAPQAWPDEQTPREPCLETIPPERRERYILGRSYHAPLLYKQVGTGFKRPKSIRRPYEQIKLRFDDGQWGTITVIERTGKSSQLCHIEEDEHYTDECGCFLYDGFLLQVKDAKGRKVVTIPLWAAYGLFRIAVADVVGGQGDEIFVIRWPNRGTFSIHYDLHVWCIRGRRLIDLGNVGEIVGGGYYGCLLWRENIYVMKANKNRAIMLRKEFIRTGPLLPGCDKPVRAQRLIRFNKQANKFETSPD